MASIFDQYRNLWRIGLILVSGILIVILGVLYFEFNTRPQETSKPIISQDKSQDDYEIEVFREYLRIPSVHPNIDYEPCIQFLKRQAKTVNLPVNVFYPSNEKNPLLIMTWLGSNPNLPSIVLNSHMDVVPAYADQWTHPPFAAEMDAEGRIFGRGAQDMKSVGTQYLGAIRALKRRNINQLKRTIHVIYAPDEEVGSAHGWKKFITTADFKALNTGFFLDEGVASENRRLDIYYAQRNTLKVYVECIGDSGHGSLILPNTAAQKAFFMMSKMLELRAKEERRLLANESLTVGDVTTINLTILKGGVHANVIPRDIKIVFDVRLAIDVDQEQFIQMINRWAVEAGPNVTVTFNMDHGIEIPTIVGPTNPFWVAVENATKQSNLTLIPRILSAAGDTRFIRRANISALAFSPLSETPILMHSHDEFVRNVTYLAGIQVYEKIITNLGNLE